MINPSDSTSVVKEQIEDAVSLAGYSAPTSWSDATDKINGTADQFERDQIADGMNGGLARDRINALFGGPVWAPEGAQLTIDFAANKAWTRNSAVTDSVDAVSLTRAGSVLMLGPDGYESFAADELARIDGIGAQVVPARVNKCTNWNANPVDLTGVTKTGDAAATLTVVDDEAALRAAGFGRLIDEGKMNGKVFKLDNSLGITNAFINLGGVTGNTNTHVVSAVMRGSGNGVLRAFSFLSPSQAFPSAYTRVATAAFTPANTSVQGMIQVDPGSVVYFILNQLEEGSYASPPIITSGAAVSRPGDILSASVPDGGRAFAFEFDLLEPLSRSGSRTLIAWRDPATMQRYALELSSTGNLRVARNGSSGWVVSAATAGTAVVGINRFYGVVATGFVRAGGLSTGETPTDTSPESHPVNISVLGVANNGVDTSANVFGYPHRFTERPVTDFSTPADAFAWAKSIAQGWAS